MAKDILKFHAVIWPALLMSAGYELPRGEFIHGYLLMGGEKMSKTRGNVLDPFQVMETYGIDPLRFYLVREVAFGQDGVISMEGFATRYTNELANELGNLVSRTVSMVAKYRGGRVPRGGLRRGRWRRSLAEGAAMVRPPRRTSTPWRSRPPRRRVGARPPPEPLRRGRGALEAGQGRGAPSTSTGAARPGRRPASRRHLRLPGDARDGDRDPAPAGAAARSGRPCARGGGVERSRPRRSRRRRRSSRVSRCRA